MPASKSKCACCDFAAADPSELNAKGVCADCAAGNHQRNCKMKGAQLPIGEPAPAPVETQKAEEPKGEPPPAASAEPAPTQALVQATPQTQKAVRTIEADERGLRLTSIEEMYRFASAVCKSGLAPASLKSPEAVMVALQFGAEVGLSPMQALQNVAPINGRPALFGDAPKAIIEASGLLEDFDEFYVHKGQRVDSWPSTPDPDSAAVCMSKRRGRRELVTHFTFAEAKLAGLWGKAGPWTQYPGRMMRFRARGFNLRDNFPDQLKGFKDEHELRDMPIEVQAEPVHLPQPRAETSATADAQATPAEVA